MLIRRILLFAFLCSLVSFVAGSGLRPAEASLRKYSMNVSRLTHQSNISPVAGRTPDGQTGLALIDNSGATPVLNKLLVTTLASSGTVNVAALAGFFFLKSTSFEGPVNNLPGTGSTASSINWGNVGGWTTSGASWCNAAPSYICGLAGRIYLDTLPQPNVSTNYDLGTWVFHGTGWIQPGGHIIFTGRQDQQGNSQWFLRGQARQDGTVPAVPLIGIVAIGASFFAAGVAAVRRRR